MDPAVVVSEFLNGIRCVIPSLVDLGDDGTVFCDPDTARVGVLEVFLGDHRELS